MALGLTGGKPRAEVKRAVLAANGRTVLTRRPTSTAQIEDQPAALVVAREQAAHLADAAAPIDRCCEAPARGCDVAEKSEQVEQIGLARGVRPDHEEPTLDRKFESLEVAPVVRGHVRDAHVTLNATGCFDDPDVTIYSAALCRSTVGGHVLDVGRS